MRWPWIPLSKPAIKYTIERVEEGARAKLAPCGQTAGASTWLPPLSARWGRGANAAPCWSIGGSKSIIQRLTVFRTKIRYRTAVVEYPPVYT